MKNKMDADIWTDEWPEFKCTVVKLPVSKVLLYSYITTSNLICSYMCACMCREDPCEY